MSHVGHETVRCIECNKIIRNCRCFSRDKPTVYEICEDCKIEDELEAHDDGTALMARVLPLVVKARKKFGDAHQRGVTIEETAELIEALAKMMAANARLGRADRVAISPQAREEVVDCLIAMVTLVEINNLWEVLDAKLKRFAGVLDGSMQREEKS